MAGNDAAKGATLAKRGAYKTDLQIRNHTEPGRYLCGDGFYLDTKPSRAKACVLRVSVGGKKIFGRGLGTYPQVKLGEARAKARVWPLKLRQGQAVGILAGKQKIAPVVNATSFRQAAEEVMTLRDGKWKSDVHRRQWRQTVEDYVYPLMGDNPVGEVTQNDIVAILSPLWASKHATASKLRSRLGMILGWAKAAKLRTDNPTRENDTRGNLLPTIPTGPVVRLLWCAGLGCG